MSAVSRDGLSQASRVVLDSFESWGRIARDQASRDSDFEARTFLDNQLLSSSTSGFNKSDVEAILRGQLQLLNSSQEKSSYNMINASAELCRAVLREADKYSVPLQIDASKILADASSKGTYVSEQAGHQNSLLMQGPKGKLAPLSAVETGGEAGKRLAEANAEIQRLHSKMAAMAQQMQSVMGDKSGMTDAMMNLQDNLGSEAARASALKRQLEEEAARKAATPAASAPITNTVTKTVEVSSKQDQDTIRALRKEIAQLNKDMSAKLNQSTQFINMKKILTEKNSQVKELRKRLMMYDPTFAASFGGDDDLIEEDSD